MTDFALEISASPQPAPARREAGGSDNSSTDVAPSALIPSFIPDTPLDRGEGKNAMPSRAMVDMTSSRPATAASARASRDWQRPVSWLPFAAENPFASVLLAGALVAGLGLAGSGVARADEATRSAAQTSPAAKPQTPAQPSMPLLLAQNDVSGGLQVALTRPAYADVLKGTASIEVGIQPGRYNVASIELFVDDRSATGGPIPLASSASTVFNWDTSKFLDGPHKLRVRVMDTQGFRSESEVQVFVNNNKALNTTPPTLSWLNAPKGGLRGKVQLQLRAAGTFGVKFIMVSLNSAATPDVKPALATWFTNVPPYIISLDTTKYPDGLYVLSALGQNGLGEEGEAQKMQIGIYNNSINPTTIQTFPADNGTGEDIDTTTSTAKNTDDQPPVPKQVVNHVPAQVTTMTKQHDGAIASGVGNSSTAARSGDATAPLISEPGLGARMSPPHSASTVKTPRVDKGTTGGTPNAGGSRIVMNPALTEHHAPAVTTPPQVSVAPLASNTAMQGSTTSQTQENGTVVADPRLAAPNPAARVEPSKVAPTHQVAPAHQGVPTHQVAPFNPNVNVVPSTPKTTNSNKQQYAMLPPTGQPKLQTREGATITVAPSQQSLGFPVAYRARKGETLQQIAIRYGLPADILASSNEIGVKEPLQDGQVIQLAQPLTVSYKGQPVKGDVSSSTLR